MVEVVVPAMLVPNQWPVHGPSTRSGADVVKGKVDGWGQDHGAGRLGKGLHARPDTLEHRCVGYHEIGVRFPAVSPG